MFKYEDEVLIGEVRKNSIQKIGVRVARINGNERIDARVSYQVDPVADGEAAEYRRTKAGINIDPDGAQELITLMLKAVDEAKRRAGDGGKDTHRRAGDAPVL